jgi:hypothetical protein
MANTEKKEDVETGDAKAPAKDTTQKTKMAMTEDGGMQTQVGPIKLQISALRLPLVGLIMSSAVLISAIFSYGGGWSKPPSWRIYSIVYPCVTAAIAVLALIMTCKEGYFEKKGMFLGLFLFIWNFIGASLLTFYDPFTTTGNGYFASWGLVFFSIGVLGLGGDTFESPIHALGACLGLIASSLIIIIAICAPTPSLVQDGANAHGGAVYALTVSCVTLLIFTLYILLRLESSRQGKTGAVSNLLNAIVFGTVAVFWIVLPFLCTFRGPFIETGNGYFASWAGMACACKAATAAIKKKKQE